MVAAADRGPEADGVVSVFAPAKLTLSLRIVGVRSDGYHEIDAEMVTLDFGDRLDIEPGRSGVEMIDRTGRPHPGWGEDDDDNLVRRALALARRTARVTVTKAVPAGAGLGGGSADAAAVLRWAGFGDVEAATSIGADVGFCLAGGRARVRGIGEIIDPQPHIPERYTLLIPPVVCPTPAVYAAWDDLGGPAGPNGNDLEPAALAAFPELARWRDEFADATGRTPRLAGSGGTWFVAGAHPGPGHLVTSTFPSQ